MISFPHSRGSLLVWTVLLGSLLSTAFLFFAVRYSQGMQLQRYVMRQQASERFFESTLNYFKSLPESDLLALESETLTLNTGEGGPVLEGFLTNDAVQTTGFLDAGQQVSFPSFNDTVVVWWNPCEEKSSDDPPLEVNLEIIFSDDDQCALGGANSYDRFFTVNAVEPLTLNAAGGPVSYKLENTTPGRPLSLPRWQIFLALPLGFGQWMTRETFWVPAENFAEAPEA